MRINEDRSVCAARMPNRRHTDASWMTHFGGMAILFHKSGVERACGRLSTDVYYNQRILDTL